MAICVMMITSGLAPVTIKDAPDMSKIDDMAAVNGVIPALIALTPVNIANGSNPNSMGSESLHPFLNNELFDIPISLKRYGFNPRFHDE